MTELQQIIHRMSDALGAAHVASLMLQYAECDEDRRICQRTLAERRLAVELIFNEFDSEQRGSDVRG